MPSSTSSTYTLVIFLFLPLGTVFCQLSNESFYSTSCPSAISTIRTAVSAAVATEARMGASLLRLHFHDCFVDGCDASLLLDDNSTFTGEKTAAPNNGSVRGFEVIDNIKTQLEELCPGVVSCADILAVAARDSVVELGGLTWDVQLGRRDSAGANITLANSDLPAPTSNLSALIASFSDKGLTVQDLVALSGAHTIGQARCTSFRARIYNDTNINSTYASSLQENCPVTGGDDNLSPLDVTSPILFDNAYFTNLQTQRGLLHSDQELFDGSSTNGGINTYSSNQATFFSILSSAMTRMGAISPLTVTSGSIRTSLPRRSDQELLDDSSTNGLVNTYSSDQETFFTDFSSAMISMGAISPLTGTSGSIRTNCRVAN